MTRYQAIHIREYVSFLSNQQIDQVVNILSEAGSTARIGSIHVDGCRGHCDNFSIPKMFAKNSLNTNASGGEGFAEVAAALLAAHRGRQP